MATPVAVIPDPKEAPLEAISSSASGSKDGLSTVHLYYSDTELYSNTARVTSVHEVETSSGEKTALVLDETVMHPQGGGQPADSGVISSFDGSIKFEVSHVQKPKGCKYIEHLGTYVDDKRFAVGDEVRVEIDAVKRRFHARLHSAGHLLDSAFTNIGMMDLIPSKGYHFPDGPYVEYIGNVAAEKRDDVLRQLNKEAERLIQEAIPVIVAKNEKGDRMVNVGGTECACGGTHVKNTADIVGITITRIKKSKKNVRISYLLTHCDE